MTTTSDGQDETAEAIAALVRRRLDPAASMPAEAGEPVDLDSLALVALVVDLEAAFAVRFPADVLTRETFRSVASITEAVRAVRGRTPAA